ncbi:MAG: hypothetical protein LBP22_16075 [Deltaproteobacteria bacterium]|nr:hypothetical protein [Deltaproteobacteria bacterium]
MAGLRNRKLRFASFAGCFFSGVFSASRGVNTGASSATLSIVFGAGSKTGTSSRGGISRTSVNSSLPQGLPPSGSYREKSMTANGLKLVAGSARLKVTITTARNSERISSRPVI